MNNTFVCEVILPEKSPIRGLTGSPATRKSTAKQSAAFDTCLLLRRHKLLDDYFHSIYHRRLPAMRNAKLAITSKATKQYDMIAKPSFWRRQQGALPEELHATVITFNPSKPLLRAHESIVILTREALPSIPQFSVFLDDDIETDVCSTSVKGSLTVVDHELESLTTFTLRVFRDVFNKTYERQMENMPYWLAPASIEGITHSDPRPWSVIDWDLVSFVEDNDEIPRSHGAKPEFYADRFVYDVWNGRYRYFTIAVDDNLTPSDKPPAIVPYRRHMENIMNYCVSLSKNSRAGFLAKCDWSQPVVRAELVRLRRNFLDRMSDTEKEVETRVFICMEPLKISAVSSSHVQAGSLLTNF